MAAIEVPPRHHPRSAQDEALRFARTCYDHSAGRLGVAIADALIAKGYVVLAEDGGEVTTAGRKFLSGFGAWLETKSNSKRMFCRACLDWSERRHHIAGLVGVELLRRCLALGWLARERNSRAVTVTAAGRAGLRDTFGVDSDALTAAAPRMPARAAPKPARAGR